MIIYVVSFIVLTNNILLYDVYSRIYMYSCSNSLHAWAEYLTNYYLFFVLGLIIMLCDPFGR